jgi:hypothetical protein
MNPTPNKYLTIGILIILLSLHFFTSDRVDAQSGLMQYTVLSVSGSWSPIGCDSDVDICIAPGESFSSSAYIEFTSGFPSELPAVGVGVPGLGYFSSDFPLAGCSASGGYGPGNSTSDGYICERSFNNPNAGSGTAYFTISIREDAVPGTRYNIGYTTNGGSNVLSESFVVQIRGCSIRSFTCSTNAELSWITSNCTNRNITPSIGNVSATGSIGGSAGTTYTLTASDSINTRTSTASCLAPELQARWSANNSTTYSRTLTTTELNQGWADINFNYDNVGQVGSCVYNIQCQPNPT